MAKIPFSKLKCKINDEVKIIDFADEKIEVKQYLPTQEKLELIGKVIEQSHEEDGNYSNPVKIDIFTKLEIIYYYTNISFTEAQKRDIPKLFDQIQSSNLLATIIETIPSIELTGIVEAVQKSVLSVYSYRNSLLGIMDTIQNNYSNIKMDVDGLQKEVAELENSSLIKEIVPLLGLN